MANLQVQALIDTFDARVAKQIAGPVVSPRSMAALFAGDYFVYSKTGVVPGVGVAAGGTESLLADAFLVDNTAGTPERMGNSIAEYWKTVTTPGTPAHGGSSVTAVQVLAINADFIAAVESVITTVLTSPLGTHTLHHAIQDVLLGTQFIVTELIEGTPTDFIEFIT